MDLKNSLSRKSHPALFYMLLFIILWVPLPLGSNRPWAWSLLEFFIFLLASLCFVSLKSDILIKLRPYKTVIFLWSGYITLLILQMIPLPSMLASWLSPNAFDLYQKASADTYYLSVDIGQTFITFYKSLSFLVFFAVVLVLVDNIKRLKMFLLTIFTSAVLQALYGTFEILVGMEHSLIFGLSVNENVTGSFVYKNHFANFIMLGLAAGLGLMVASLQESRPTNTRDWMRNLVNALLGNKALIRISLAIMVIALVMSKSRMGNAAFFVSMTICGLLALVVIKNRTRGLTILIISMFVVDLFIVSAYFGLGKVQERLAQTSFVEESRDEVVRDGLPLFADYPIFGSGAGSFYSIFPSYKKAEVHSFYDHAHNDYLQTLTEVGGIASILLAIIVLLSLYTTIKAMSKRKMSIMKGGAFASCMAIVGMLIHMTVDFPIQSPSNALIFISFLAIAWIVGHIKAEPRR